MLVVNGELIAVSKRVPGHVVGDGEHTIEELVEIVNEDPRRGIGHEKVLTRLEFDHQAERLLELKGYGRESVPPAGEVVYLRSTGNLSTGGTAIDVTDVVHPDNREMAVRAAQAIGLDVGGVDFLTTDITQLLQGDRRRDLRGQRGARLPHARRAQRGQAARRRRAGDGHALPARRPDAHPDRRDHRHERQDHDHPHARPHPQDGRRHRRPDDHRRRLHRRPPDGATAT